MNVDSAVCHELIVKENSHFSSGKSFYRFNSLVDLVIGDNCVSSNYFVLDVPMPSLQHITIGQNCFNEKSENCHFNIDKQPMLQSICIGSGSFTTYTKFRISNCPKLKHIQIGTIPVETNDWLLNYNQFSHCFQHASLFELYRILFGSILIRCASIRVFCGRSRLFPGDGEYFIGEYDRVASV